jgi:dTDP-4-dehydrorhamnose reductase
VIDSLVVGASGQTGAALVRRLTLLGRAVLGTYSTRAIDGGRPLDLADRDEVMRLVEETRPKAIFNPAGMTNVDECERRPDEALAVNGLAPGWLAEAANLAGAALVHFSTDYVFDGEAGPYAETDEPRPLSVYGRSKLEGERAVLGWGARGCVIRTCVVFSRTPGHGNFFSQVYGRLREGRKVTPFKDQFVNPTWAEILAEAAIEAADLGLSGLLHVGGADWLSRLEFCERLALRFGFPLELLEPVETGSVKLPARRPLKAGLKIDLARRLLKTRLMGLDEAFAGIAGGTPSGGVL